MLPLSWGCGVSPQVEVIHRFSEVQIVNVSGWDWTNKLAPAKSIDLKTKKTKALLHQWNLIIAFLCNIFFFQSSVHLPNWIIFTHRRRMLQNKNVKTLKIEILLIGWTTADKQREFIYLTNWGFGWNGLSSQLLFNLCAITLFQGVLHLLL